MVNNCINAFKFFYEKHYDDAFKEFLSLGMFYECGYCKFIQGDIENARLFWQKIQTDSPAKKWGENIINLCYSMIPQKLTFFQIRNFLERDLQLLIENNQLTYVENIINTADVLAEFNPESYKYIGRVLMNNGYYDLAENFLLKSKDICYNDCEIHFLLAQFNLAKGNVKEAMKILDRAISINSGYFPAQNLINQLLTLKIGLL